MLLESKAPDGRRASRPLSGAEEARMYTYLADPTPSLPHPHAYKHSTGTVRLTFLALTETSAPSAQG